MLDRTQAPAFHTDFTLKLPGFKKNFLTNGVPVFSIQSETIDVFRIEVVYPYGKLDFPGISNAHFFLTLLNRGSAGKTASQVAESFERLGGFISVNQDAFKTTFSLYGMSELFDQYLPLLEELVFKPDFPEAELVLAKKQALQNYQVNLLKTEFVANKNFNSIIYGEENVLGQTLVPDNIQSVSRDQLRSLYDQLFNGKGFEIFLSGKYPENVCNSLNKYFGKVNLKFEDNKRHIQPIDSLKNERVSLTDSVQGTVILGKWMFSQKHPDYIPFFVTNTILGGYFGSRLMKNIREEKGLTYGISSRLITTRDSGIFKLTTHLNKTKLDEALTEIYNEIEILKNEPVSQTELDTVISYMKGSILSNTNTIFDIMDRNKTIYFNGLKPDFYEQVLKETNLVSPEKIMEIAGKYLNDFSEIIVE